MKVTIATAGSRGDVQPYVALGRGLVARGHDVTLATHVPFEGFVRAHGLGFLPLAADPRALVGAEAGLRMMEQGANPVTFIQSYGEVLGPWIEPLMESLHAAVATADAVIYAPLTVLAFDFAEARGIPAVCASPLPLSATRAFPFVVWPPTWDLGPLGNWLTHQAAYHAISIGLKPHVDRWRRRLALPALPFGGFDLARQRALAASGFLYGFSPHVVRPPADWPSTVAVTGAWHLEADAGYEPPPDLAAFLAAGAAGDRPVYVGFGSMIGRDRDRLARTVADALARAGRRGVVLAGWGGLEALPDAPHMHVVQDVPHAWLFPRMAAVVHHGGAGTTAAGMRAGVPAVVAPYFADQPFWAQRVHALGVGPAPLPQASLTAASLARAIAAACEDPAMAARAADLGERLRAEDGVARAGEAFERFAALGAASSARR